MDAFPAYTFFETDRKVLCAIQIIDDTVSGEDLEAVTDETYVGTENGKAITGSIVTEEENN